MTISGGQTWLAAYVCLVLLSFALLLSPDNLVLSVIHSTLTPLLDVASRNLLSPLCSVPQGKGICAHGRSNCTTKLEAVLQSIHDCLGSPDWATRKAAADTLSTLAMHSNNLIMDGATSTLAALEACRFDKIKPVRDSMTEALQLWKKVAGKGDGVSDDQKATSHDGENSEPAEFSDKNGPKVSNPGERKAEASGKDSSNGSSLLMILFPKLRVKLETRGSDDLPVEVVVPRRCLNSANSHNEEESEPNDADLRGRSNLMEPDDVHGSVNIKISIDINQRESSGSRVGFSKTDVQSEGSFMNNKGNWLAIQRQLLQLERQQAHLMNMLQDFMGGSHDSMVTLENRVRGLERVVEDMARDLSISSGRRGGNFMVGFEGSSNRSLGKYNGYPDYSSAKLGRGSDGRIPFGERFGPSDGIASGMRGRGPPWRSDMAEAWDFQHMVLPKMGKWALGELCFKDEATLEAIRVAGEDSGATRTARVAMPELTAEAMGDDNVVPERDPVWTSWSNAMDALHVGDMDSAYAEVLSTGDDLLLVKLMDRSGPVIDQLSNDVASEILHAVGQFLLEQNLLISVCLGFNRKTMHLLVDVVMENGPDIMGIPIEVKRELLLNLNEASATTDPPEDWEGATPDQLLLQLASAWGIDLQQLEK
ncbi:Microtubule-associated protein TORTIFOLIA1 [Vitis vinifera]|uniref:Microtubule-associated protein TORTIFOLIA1 n=1 Tax=Vitis vinifera TaxID=29760 RepID=A0A438IS61_VITVI|nr:Microtubule-associated protein TORTIFOLIA1 [Vitis vinifera]